MATDRLSEFKLDTGDEIKADRDCAASGCLKLQCVRNCHFSSSVFAEQGTENASTENVSRRDEYGSTEKYKYEDSMVENTTMENSSTAMHGWNTQVRKTQVHVCSGRKRKYENVLSDVDMTGK